jgi:hypothetical protein
MVGVMPVPFNVTVLSVASGLLRVIVALYACAAVGAKVTDTDPPPEGKDVGVTVNAAAPVPLFVTEIAPDKLTPVTVTVCSAEVVPVMTLPKFNDVGLTVMVGVMPVPLNVTVLSVAPGLLSVMIALYACAAVGEKVTFMVPPVEGNEAGVTVNAAAPVPLFVTVILPVKFVPDTAIVCAAEVVPVITLPKSNDDGSVVMAMAAPVPLKVTVLSATPGLLKVSVAL